MKTAYLQCHAGISGDMFLSALLDAGLSEQNFREMLKSVDVTAEELIITKTIKKGITATTLEVHPCHERHHLHVSDIREKIKLSGLDEKIINRALAAFERIVKAESTVHGVPYDNVHLHEVSGLDTIIDLLGVSWGVEELGIKKIYSTPINVGSGTVKISHGVVSVPAPATALILKGIPIICDGLPGERTTPTGAALAAEFVDSFETPGKFTINQIGYGAGKLDSGDRANVLRLLVCSQDSSDDGSKISEQLTMIETDIDDDSPEIIGYLLERLNGKPGVLDVSLVQTLRKKNRPGFLLRILAVPAIAEAVRRIIFQETSTLGVRESIVLRHSVNREVLNSVTPWGSIRVIRA
ncbi:nickel pincer cofactor biosynthesis protein LarC, partial [bacterium]|nr:nickel pincer cofactor biosynthesis protein LarC [bacterium]